MSARRCPHGAAAAGGNHRRHSSVTSVSEGGSQGAADVSGGARASRLRTGAADPGTDAPGQINVFLNYAAFFSPLSRFQTRPLRLSLETERPVSSPRSFFWIQTTQGAHESALPGGKGPSGRTDGQHDGPVSSSVIWGDRWYPTDSQEHGERPRATRGSCPSARKTRRRPALCPRSGSRGRGGGSRAPGRGSDTVDAGGRPAVDGAHCMVRSRHRGPVRGGRSGCGRLITAPARRLLTALPGSHPARPRPGLLRPSSSGATLTADPRLGPRLLSRP